MSAIAGAEAVLPEYMVVAAVRAALAEDLGQAGDITTNSIVDGKTRLRAVIAAREDGRIAGIALAAATFRELDPDAVITVHIGDGGDVVPGDNILSIEGDARALLTAERTALNFLGHLSGIATATRNLVRLVKGTRAQICCTRKTTPGLRAFEKRAVRAGGGVNHRFGLDDAVLIKDNHVAVAGGIVPAIEAARGRVGHMVKIEVEVDTLSQLDEALGAGADIVLLDNMPPEALRTAVERTAGQAVLEASGGITAETVRSVAEAGVDLISVGWITHSAPCLDLGLDFEGIG